MPNINKLVSRIDLFGQPVAITFFKREKVQTTFGGVCTLLFICFVGWAIYNMSQNMTMKKNPKVVTIDTFAENPRGMTLTDQNFPMAFSLQTPDEMFMVEFVDDDIYTLELVKANFTRIRNSDGTVSSTTYTEDIIDLETCTLDHFGDMAESFQYLNLPKMKCIAKSQSVIEDIYLAGNFDSPYNYQLLILRVKECNDTVLGNTCKSSTIRDQYLAGAYLNVIYTNMVVDSNNYKNPESRFRDLYYTMINPDHYKASYINLEHVTVSTDQGWLVESNHNESFVRVSGTREFERHIPYENILISVSMQVSKKEQITYRSYDKVQTVLAEIGSLLSVAFVVGALVLKPYTKLKMKEALMNKLFDVPKPPNTPNSPTVVTVKRRDSKRKTSNIKTVAASTDLEIAVMKSKFQDSPIHTPTHSPKAPSVKNETFGIPAANKNTGYSFQDNNKKKSGYPFKFGQQGAEKTTYPIAESPTHNTSRALNKDLTGNDWVDAINDSPSHGPEKRTNDTWKSQTVNRWTIKPKKVMPEYMNSAIEVEPLEDLERETPSSPKGVERSSSIMIIKGDEKEDAENVEHAKMHLTFFEYIRSFIHMSPPLKKKMEILNCGEKNIGDRMDLINIMKKFREIDKLKMLLLDDVQYDLFKNIPHPEVKTTQTKEKAFIFELLKNLSFIDPEHDEDTVQNLYNRLQNKQEKSEADRKLIEIFSKRKV